ncbi:DUF6134 family protein [Telmatospirillum sp.]|uniref:DUF6134 family protein n=1 Tax=Telmatospirillum sp. TaxID=2079197 RepID=UPI00284CFE9C|nr:DUF6134 family protein [Telmatospirillum sp.]MDR3435134.1 DUF6134 family protein [Telmatospirillum sp.]
MQRGFGLRFRRVGWACVAVLLAVPAMAGSIASPAGRALDFDILRKGEMIGHYHADFVDEADHRLEVRTRIRAEVTAGPIRLYHFTHQSAEVWQGDRLVSLAADTDDDGEIHHLVVSRDGPTLLLTVDDKTHAAALDAVPSSLWNRGMLDGKRPIFDMTDGQVFRIETRCAAAEAAGSCEISGELTRKLDYDADGMLVGLSFLADDGSKVMYRRN